MLIRSHGLARSPARIPVPASARPLSLSRTTPLSLFILLLFIRFASSLFTSDCSTPLPPVLASLFVPRHACCSPIVLHSAPALVCCHSDGHCLERDFVFSSCVVFLCVSLVVFLTVHPLCPSLPQTERHEHHQYGRGRGT